MGSVQKKDVRKDVVHKILGRFHGGIAGEIFYLCGNKGLAFTYLRFWMTNEFSYYDLLIASMGLNDS
jgi:hypothetical protein